MNIASLELLLQSGKYRIRREVDVEPVKGSTLFFRHGFDVESVLHEGRRVTGSHTKNVIRINVMDAWRYAKIAREGESKCYRVVRGFKKSIRSMLLTRSFCSSPDRVTVKFTVTPAAPRFQIAS
jgi:hypothetical protein